VPDRRPPRFARLVRIGGTDESEPRHRPQRHQVLDRLVGRAVLAEPDGVVRPNEDDGQLVQRRQAHGGAHVVGEAEERRDERPDAAVVRHAIGDRRHGVLPHTEMKIAPGSRLPVETAAFLQRRVRRDAQVRVPSDELRQLRGDRVLDFSGGRARGLLFAGLENRQIRVPPVGKKALDAPPPLGGHFGEFLLV
jgi:hypothetical protein